MNALGQYRSNSLNKIIFSISVCLIFLFGSGGEKIQAKTRSQSKSKRHSRLVKKHHPTKEEELLAREAAAREIAEAKVLEDRNIILTRAYKLYDSGTSESLLGNYKYSVLQLKLADELLREHGQTNSSLALVTLMALASSAREAKEYSLARSAYGRLLSMRPQDTDILLGSAKLEASLSNFNDAQNYLNRLLDSDPNNMEGRLLANFVVNKLKPTTK